MRVRLTIEDDSGRTYHGELVLGSQGTAKKASRKEPKMPHVSASPTKPAQALRHLHAQGIFKAERTLKGVEAELEKMDCNFPKASLAKALELAKFLTRRGTRGKYRWIQRYKPGA